MTALEKTILIIEDDEGLQSQLKWHFDDFDTTIAIATDTGEALAAIRHHQPSVIIQDLGLPPDPEGVSEGFRCIQEILNLAPRSKIIVLTGKSDRKNALKAIELGAYDFYSKPVEPETLNHVVSQAFRIAQLEFENLNRELKSEPIPGIVSSNQKMRNICRMIEKISQTNVTTTLIGESGTGKEVLARAIHRLSDHASQPFVAINCAAVPESLMESELFGHEKGAFTGATQTTQGKVEQANGGTLFLDEIGDMPLNLQAKLLRFLQERYIVKVGGREEIKVDLRVVCATNKNLEDMVQQGTFREDLYYRICEIVVNIPPLRERGSDALLVASHMLNQHSERLNAKAMRFSTAAAKAIESYNWPGNIREIENRVKRAIVLAENSIIQVEDLDIAGSTDRPSQINLKEVRRNAEIEAISSALKLTQQNISAAAKLLGITRPTLYDMIKKYNILSEDE